ncbi:hypothetical protein Rhe02_23460 [Rhizocola hellebori]|uniref:DUF4190 domain-containing protein n=1 Tax=Rhizocola hellebori TaxID=1392758 RepID=A0A8J3Q6G3_9ACTN|nr:hypothetical protein [Rhizocola hellebori]GIH04279.1 hypothetical protein Rhe02_23460 [Rhizocola hellebori]
MRIEMVPDAPYGLAILPASVTTSGVAIGSTAAGTGSLLVSGVVWCFGLMGAEGGWGGLVSGAFGVLAVLLGIGAIGLGWAGVRQIRRGGASKGRGYAISGLICGGAGILLAASGVVVAIALVQRAAAGT